MSNIDHSVYSMPKKHEALRTEFLRKSIHISGVLVIPFALLNHTAAIGALIGGILLYLLSERLRLTGMTIPIVGSLTRKAKRDDEGPAVIMGPLYWMMGILLSLTFFPSRAAIVAILCLTLSDSAAALVGKSLGSVRPTFLGGKSVEGSLACFAVSLICSYSVMKSPGAAIIIALVVMVAEALPFKNIDNASIPASVLIASFLIGVL